MSVATPAELVRKARLERYMEEDREALQKQGDFRQLSRLLKYLRPRRAQVILAVVLSMGLAALTPVPMLVIKHTIDSYIMPGHFKGVVFFAGILLGLQLAVFMIEVYTSYLIAKLGQHTMRDLRLEVFEHIQSQSLRFFDKNPVGRLITRLTSDVNTLNELFSQGIVGVFQQVFSLVAILVVLFYTNWYLTLWVLLTVPLMLVASWNFRNNVFIAFRLARVRLSRMNTFMQENLTGMRTVQSNTREDSQHETFDVMNDAHRDAHLKTVFQYAVFFPLVETISALGLALVLWKGGLQYIAPTGALGAAVTVGQLTLFIQALDRFFQPIKDLSEKYNIIQASIASGERLFNLLDTKPIVVDEPTPIPFPEFRHQIEFRDVWFAYQGEEWVLKGISFTVKKGQNIAIVGPTGSGKTTLMSLLCRFYDIQKGAILIDGIDIRQMKQSDLREKVAIVMQDVFLFFGSVTENIRLGNASIDEARVRHVSEQTGFDRFVTDMPKGYDSGVKERGATLSTGQKQLLSFARALAFDPQILILDEATANVDTETEDKLQAAVRLLCAGRTSLVIAHRLSTIQRADAILVIHQGHLVEQGTHAELLAGEGLYRKLYELQYEGIGSRA